ncbi:MAG: SLBB domain-containing protein [Cyanobacteria bacterium J06621_11]
MMSELRLLLRMSLCGVIAAGGLAVDSSWAALAQVSVDASASERVGEGAQSVNTVPSSNAAPSLPQLTDGLTGNQRSIRPAQSVSAAVSAAPPQIDDAYTLGAGDTIQVDIFNVPEYSGAQQVLADGSVNLAAIRPVNVNGLTPQEAESAIASAYAGELRYPRVTVVLSAPRPLRVAIAGEVGEPGLYTLQPEGDAQFPTVSQALQQAGGVTQAADLQNVQLRRANGNRPGQVVTLDLWQLLNNGDMRQDVVLRDGDTIVINETDEVNLAATNQLAATTLASSTAQDITVAVVGEVFRPGAYEIKGSETNGRTTVTQVVQTAGGIRPSADIRQIQVRRLTRGGSEQLIDLDFWQLLQEGDLNQDLVLQQGDTVIIPVASALTPNETAQLTAANFSPDTVSVNVVGEVASPGALTVSPETTLNQAVLAAGGFTTRSTETVELIRLNPNGSVTQREIEVNLSEGIDSERNPLILNNDVVLVGRNGRARFNDSVTGIFRPLMQLLSPFRLF